MRKNVAVFYGGRSCEHDISIITAIQAMGYINDEKYDVSPIYMRDGNFYTGDCLDNIESYQNFNARKFTKLILINGIFYSRIKNLLIKKFKPDVALICCHGGEGENGSLQGMLEMNNIPYTSSGVLSSALGMDKILSKMLFQGLMLNTVEEITVLRDEFKSNSNKTIQRIEALLKYPIIVKPSSLGSSIGIKRANNREELIEAITVASAFDNRIIAERALVDFIELNCAVVSDGKNIIVSEVERPISWQEYLTFEDKYLTGGKGMSDSIRELPAKISETLYENIQSVSERLYTELDLSGVVRIDYLLADNGKLFVNEINTIPGSLAFYLFEPKGLTFTDLIDILIDGAMYKANIHKENKLAFQSNVLRNFGGGKVKHLHK